MASNGHHPKPPPGRHVTQMEIAMSPVGPATFPPVRYDSSTCDYLELAFRSASHPSSHDLVETPATNSLVVTKATDVSSLMSRYNEAQTL